MQLIAGSSNYPLAQKISCDGNIHLLDVKISHFNDGELKIKINEPVARNIFILQSLQKPIGEYLLELLLLADTAKRNGARQVTAIIPYLGYSRQDRITTNNDALSAKLLLDILEKSPIDKIFTLDIHSNYLARIATLPFINITSTQIFLPIIANRRDLTLISPDVGGASRVEHYRYYLNNIYTQKLTKIRTKDNQCQLITKNFAILTENYFIIDDILDSGNSLCETAKLLKQNGVKSINAFVTHGILSMGAIQKIEESAIDHIFITDSIKQPNLTKKFIIISTANAIVRALQGAFNSR